MSAPTLTLAPAKARRRARPSIAPYIWAAALWLPVGALLGVIGYRLANPPTAAQFDQPAPTAIAQRAFPGAVPQWSGAGTWTVPGQVAPGRYMLTTDSSTFVCTYRRLAKLNSSKPKDELQAGTVTRGDQQMITVLRSDAALELSGRCLVMPA